MRTDGKEKKVFSTIQELIDYLNSQEDGVIISVTIETEEVQNESEQ